MLHFWNYLGKSSYFETRFLDNRVIANWKFLKIKIKKILELEFLEKIQVEL